MQKLKATVFLICFSLSLFAQISKKPKQCFRSVDFVDPIKEEILKTDTYDELCIQIINDVSAKVWINNIEKKLVFQKSEFLEVDENGVSTYRAVATLENENFEIYYVKFEDTYRTSIVSILNRYVKEFSRKLIVQYKIRS